MTDSIRELQEAKARKGSLLQTVGAVMWSFFGVRKGASHDADLARLNPVHVVIVGVLMGIAFVVGLVSLVGLITA
ncbi:MAG: hypothetical protein RLY30_720 [Pseudomonadota bacterium]|jgi:hypothetical protein